MSKSEEQRAAWTNFVEGRPVSGRKNKYANEKTEVNGRKYDSKREAKVAASLACLAAAGNIADLREQVRVTLIEGSGNVRSVVWVADFVYTDGTGRLHYLDAKGFRTPVYRLKKRLAFLLKGIEIEEV